MRDEFNPHFTEFLSNSSILLKHGIRLDGINLNSWDMDNGVFRALVKVFRVLQNFRYLFSPVQSCHWGRVKYLYRLIALSILLLLISACGPSEVRNAPLPPAQDPHSRGIAVASHPSKLNHPVLEPVIAKQTPQSIDEDLSSEGNTVTENAVHSELLDFASPDTWKDLPVIPEISASVVQAYAIGISRGNNPRAFSKIGDCSTSNAWFLGPFDDGEQYYRLGEHTYLEVLIEHFKGSFNRNNITTRNGFSASSTLSPLWADPEVCESGETPLACEYRIHKPSIVFIMLGTNDRWHTDHFEENMREIIEYTLDRQIIPIVATKADNFEGDESINRTLAQLAIEYHLPLWNFWAAAQELPNQGLEEDGVHLTWGPTHFNDPEVMKLGWPTRNLTAMQVLHALWQAVQDASVDETAVLR